MEIIKNGFLIPPHLLTNFEIQKYRNEPRSNGVYSRDNLTKIKDGAYVINILDLTGLLCICKIIIMMMMIIIIIIIIIIIQAYVSITCGYFCIGFIDFMLKGKT